MAAEHETFQEDMSKLRIRLVLEARRRKARVIALLGLTTGAGVTTLAVSLACETASQGEPVVLVDANVSAPAVHRRLGIELKPGVAEASDVGADLKPSLRELYGGRLRALPGGEWRHHSTALSPERWAGLFDLLREHDGIVLVDAGAKSGLNADGIVSASDGVVCVVEAGGSRWEQVAALSQHLDELKSPLLGVAVNKRRFPIPEFVYRHL